MSISSLSSVLSSGLQGVQSGIKRVDQAAGKIANMDSPAGDGDLAGPIVDLKLGEIQVKASVNVIEASDQMLGSLIDTKA